jgi:cold shock CspA family protein
MFPPEEEKPVEKPHEKTMVGEITLFDPAQKVGVVTIRPMTKNIEEKSQDVFFIATDLDLTRLRQGQLVQFVMYQQDERWLAKDIEILSSVA